MKRLVGTALGVVVFACVAATAVGAPPATTLAGTSTWTVISTPEQGLISATYDIHGTFDGPIGRGTYAGSLHGGALFQTGDCGDCEHVTGAITFTTAHRGSFTAEAQEGSVVALQDIASHSFRTFTLTLKTVSGTGSYAHAQGMLSLTYESIWSHYFDSELLVFINRIDDTGTLTGNPWH